MTITTIKRVRAQLWNDRRTYNIQLELEVRELRGQKTVPDDYAVARVTLLAGIAVEDDTYNLEYTFNGKEEKKTVRLVDGLFMSPWRQAKEN